MTFKCNFDWKESVKQGEHVTKRGLGLQYQQLVREKKINKYNFTNILAIGVEISRQ